MDAAAVMARYRLKDPRTARRVMRQAGAIKVARRLLVTHADLLVYEADRRRELASDAPVVRLPTSKPAPRRSAAPVDEPLAPGWWRAA